MRQLSSKCFAATIAMLWPAVVGTHERAHQEGLVRDNGPVHLLQVLIDPNGVKFVFSTYERHEVASDTLACAGGLYSSKQRPRLCACCNRFNDLHPQCLRLKLELEDARATCELQKLRVKDLVAEKESATTTDRITDDRSRGDEEGAEAASGVRMDT